MVVQDLALALPNILVLLVVNLQHSLGTHKAKATHCSSFQWRLHLEWFNFIIDFRPYKVTRHSLLYDKIRIPLNTSLYLFKKCGTQESSNRGEKESTTEGSGKEKAI